MFNNIGILGLGLIGGSLAKAIKKYNYNATIYGYNRSTQSAIDALNEGVIDYHVTDFSDFSICDLIVLCAPVAINIKLFEQLKPHLKNNVVITDVGSTKSDIYNAFTEIDYNGYFIGGHPMAGSEQSGFGATRAELFENAYYVLTPEPSCPFHYIEDMVELVKSLHGLPIILEPDKHDYIVAAISHVPHVLASTLVNMVENLDSEEKEMYTLAAGGFKDFTRIASASPDMWQQICLANHDSVIQVLDEFDLLLHQVRNSISNKNEDEIYQVFSQSKQYRNSFQDKFRGSLERKNGITVEIEDEPGVIAEIASLLARHQINIKNIGINHNREDYEGVLEILFYDTASLKNGTDVLKSNNYSII